MYLLQYTMLNIVELFYMALSASSKLLQRQRRYLVPIIGFVLCLSVLLCLKMENGSIHGGDDVIKFYFEGDNSQF